MTRIAVVTDSTCDLPVELRQQCGVHVVPLSVIFGDETYLDGVDLTADEFFVKLQQRTVHPSTSQPAPGDFAKVYEQLITSFDHVISLHISSELSGTYQAACVARDMFPAGKITVLNTKSASIGLGWITILAARAIAEGKNVAEVVRLIEQAAESMRILLTVETLEWLQRNGRIGKASAMVGTLLSVKPVLLLENGVITPHSKVRGKVEKVMSSMVKAADAFVPYGTEVFVGIVHGERPEKAQGMVELLKEVYDVKEVIVTSVGPVIGVHTGPGTVGFSIIPIDYAMKEE